MSDIGSVLAEKPYINCLYCDGASDLEETQATIAQVSLMVYEFESSRR